MASTQQNKDFIATLLPSYPLDEAVEWIKANLSPGDVFDDAQLAEYARSNIEIDDVYSEQNILDYVARTYNPSEVFEVRDLESWAEDDGYMKE